MKTTYQERLAHKEKRRFLKLQELVNRLNLRIEASQAAEKAVNQALLSVSLQGNIKDYLDAIRRAN